MRAFALLALASAVSAVTLMAAEDAPPTDAKLKKVFAENSSGTPATMTAAGFKGAALSAGFPAATAAAMAAIFDAEVGSTN